MTTPTDKQQVIKWLEDNSKQFIDMSDTIWANPEINWYEFKASSLQADFLEKEGFTVTRDVAGMNTAFIAEWGEGKPVIGFIGEYDALPGLSQKSKPTKEPLVEGGAGHGCGHNLLGSGVIASTVAVQKWMQEHNISGTVRYYGCPAEEGGGAKVFMARAGLFDDLDAAFNSHPEIFNMARKGGFVGINILSFRFIGRSAHAAAAHLGRSALDAVELTNVGVNYLREHVKDSVRMHYVITNGGEAANIVPEEAEVQYMIRAETSDYLREVTDRVRKVAEGATLMTGTKVEEKFMSGFSNMINNHRLADLQYEALQLIGPIEFTPEEHAFAQKINDAYPQSNSDYIDNWIEIYNPPAELSGILDTYRDKALIGGNFPSIDQDYMEKGATDVGDLSKIVPVSLLYTTCFTTGSPGHSWGNVATSGMSIGHKGMMHAAKVMALAAMDLYTQPEILRQVREEFEKIAKPYDCPIPANLKPPRYQPED